MTAKIRKENAPNPFATEESAAPEQGEAPQAPEVAIVSDQLHATFDPVAFDPVLEAQRIERERAIKMEAYEAQVLKNRVATEAAFELQKAETYEAIRNPVDDRKKPATNVATKNQPGPGEVGFNPFTYVEPAKVDDGPEKLTEPEDLVPWVTFVNFVQTHRAIIQARYPNPRGPVIDTLFKGVQVFNHPTVEYRHEKFGWVSHEVALEGVK